jgi:hypothetical protein
LSKQISYFFAAKEPAPAKMSRNLTMREGKVVEQATGGYIVAFAWLAEFGAEVNAFLGI